MSVLISAPKSVAKKVNTNIGVSKQGLKNTLIFLIIFL